MDECAICLAFVRQAESASISGLVVEYVVAIDVTRVRFPADAIFLSLQFFGFRFLAALVAFSIVVEVVVVFPGCC